MTFRHFKIFLQVYESGGMTKASEALFISQPTVSQAIKELEEHYHTKLFERLGKRLYLTPAGKKLLHYVKHIVGLMSQTESALRDYSDVSPLRVGATLSIGESVFIPLLSELKSKFPRRIIYSNIHNTAILEELLLKDELDVALIEGKVQSEFLRRIPFMDDELIFVDAPSTPKIRKLSDLEKLYFITREFGSGTRTLFEGELNKHNICPHIIGVYNNSESIKQAVKAGFGVSALSRRIVEKDLNEGTLMEFTVPEISFKRVFNIVHHENKFITPVLEYFMSICLNYRK
ncbi:MULTISPECIES: LysR substrate-binding domain-containing protein [Ruminobacter]|uniref:DNA-binding transcriptional regulator, LysR family n=1 Tax=Ruminobacter amylophilus TaxID=867 RepID=A0A662ZJP9_9GAMM|nr:MULTISPECIES: LysR substrate-binding domain-containing protein [Ruminobacter]SFP70435.1 DNA-binding transcriptional regulator, LysR family [Ruminobacter amylophilus]